MASMPMALPSRSSSSPPPNMAPHIAMRATKRDAHGDGGGDRADEDVAVADVAELVGEHAAQLVPVEDLEMPWVTATAAWWGLRPVAKALGCMSGET